jgi:hypothetical protein
MQAKQQKRAGGKDFCFRLAPRKKQVLSVFSNSLSFGEGRGEAKESPAGWHLRDLSNQL